MTPMPEQDGPRVKRAAVAVELEDGTLRLEYVTGSEQLDITMDTDRDEARPAPWSVLRAQILSQSISRSYTFRNLAGVRVIKPGTPSSAKAILDLAQLDTTPPPEPPKPAPAPAPVMDPRARCTEEERCRRLKGHGGPHRDRSGDEIRPPAPRCGATHPTAKPSATCKRKQGHPGLHRAGKRGTGITWDGVPDEAPYLPLGLREVKQCSALGGPQAGSSVMLSCQLEEDHGVPHRRGGWAWSLDLTAPPAPAKCGQASWPTGTFICHLSPGHRGSHQGPVAEGKAAMNGRTIWSWSRNHQDTCPAAW